MIGSFRNFAKTKFAGLLVFLMIIPFVFWGMGSMFSSGNTNNLAKINKNNISTQEFINYINNSKILVLYNGQTINSVNNKLTNFTFTKSDFNLSSLTTVVVTSDKIQETKTKEHINCLKKYYNKDLTLNTKQKNYISHNCSLSTLDNLFQELYKRIIVPLYIPILILISLFLIVFTKENKFYQKFKLIIFFKGFLIVILSETLLRFVKNDIFYNIKIMLLPVIIFILLYFTFSLMIQKNIGSKT